MIKILKVIGKILLGIVMIIAFPFFVIGLWIWGILLFVHHLGDALING